MLDIFDRSKRNQDVIELLKDSAVFDAAVSEAKAKTTAKRLRLIDDINAAKKTFPAAGLKAAN